MKSIIALSGGMDSATILTLASSWGREVEAVGFEYGSHHNQYELKAAKNLASYYHIPFEVIDMTTISKHLKSDLLDGEIPEGYYKDESMKKTVVPGRNIIFASILAGVAWSRNAEEVWLGIHSGDHHIYPDCRPEFFHSMKKAIETGTDNKITLIAPFISIDKAEVLRRGLKLGVPYELTRTCYKPQKLACGKCGSCIERLESFKLNEIVDPVEYSNG